MQKSAMNKISTLEEEIKKLDQKIEVYKEQKEKILDKIERIKAFEERLIAQRIEKTVKISQTEIKISNPIPEASSPQQAKKLSLPF